MRRRSPAGGGGDGDRGGEMVGGGGLGGNVGTCDVECRRYAYFSVGGGDAKAVAGAGGGGNGGGLGVSVETYEGAMIVLRVCGVISTLVKTRNGVGDGGQGKIVGDAQECFDNILRLYFTCFNTSTWVPSWFCVPYPGRQSSSHPWVGWALVRYSTTVLFLLRVSPSPGEAGRG